MAADQSGNVTPITKAGGAGKAAPRKAAAGKVAGSKKAAPRKAAAAKKDGVVRAPSTVSKDGTHVDEFDGKEYPLSNFPTTKQADGSMERGHPWVIRKNLPAWREANKATRAAAKVEADKAKAAAKAAKAAEKAAADKAKAEAAKAAAATS